MFDIGVFLSFADESQVYMHLFLSYFMNTIVYKCLEVSCGVGFDHLLRMSFPPDCLGRRLGPRLLGRGGDDSVVIAFFSLILH